MHTDPIADLLTRVRNAIAVGHASVSLPNSKIKLAIAQILRDEGYIEGFNVVEHEGKTTLTLEMKYYGARRVRKPVISNIKRVSTPGRRVYVGKDEIPWVLSGMGIAILSTPKGVMTGTQARRQGIGGEVLAFVY